jgi:20S proteasome alpha/beta subunit
MTVGVAICCKDGIVMATDSLATFSRGAPVSRFTNKLFVIEHKDLLSPVAMVGAGMTAFMDKFLDRAKREGIAIAAAEIKRKLDVVDFVERVCETIVTLLVKEYAIDRNRFFGGPISDFSLSMLVAGLTSSEHGVPSELRAYHIHPIGLAESIDGYGTIGSGAPYAELFLHGLVPQPQQTSVKDGIGLACHAIKGVEIMDPNVGGETRVCALRLDNGKLSVNRQPETALPKGAKDRMENVLKKMSTDMRKVVK